MQMYTVTPWPTSPRGSATRQSGEDWREPIQGKGAFRRFKDELHEENLQLLPAWHTFRDVRARRTCIDPLPSYVWYQDMADFAERISDEAAGRSLARAIQGKGAPRDRQLGSCYQLPEHPSDLPRRSYRPFWRQPPTNSAARRVHGSHNRLLSAVGACNRPTPDRR
ncbi:hypothetical protein [Micromonospora sp. DT47]|uniref:hypothetical protein n=1 Tax=Micromonospora sp. DT47 TaxID=3393431 RepID=UPI003CEA577E